MLSGSLMGIVCTYQKNWLNLEETWNVRQNSGCKFHEIDVECEAATEK